jgi:diguanylate cyclase (GGDEF)-like protein
VDVVEEGLLDDQLPSLQRLGRLGQLGDMPTFIADLARELQEPHPERLGIGSALAAQARDHAREREALGFAPREIVMEFLLLRRVLWRFVSARAAELGTDDVLLVERRLNDTIDRLVTECVVAYFDGLLHHQAFLGELEVELERARRYRHGLALVFVDLDDFKAVNDTLGHPAGDRALERFAAAFRGSLRVSDLAGRMGGDEFASYLVEIDEETVPRFLERLQDRIDELVELGELPVGWSFSAGCASFPDEASDVDGLFRVADSRLYEAKRARAV